MAAATAKRGRARSAALSIVIPTRDTRELTLRCLESLRPVLADAQVIVVDDASIDGTPAAISGHQPGVTVVSNPRQLGFAASANRGLEEASGELLLLLNSDTEVEAGSWTALQNAFDSDPRLGIGGAQLRFPDGSVQWSAGLRPTAAWLFAQSSGFPAMLGRLPGYRRLRPPGRGPGTSVDWVSGAAMAIRRDAWEAAGPLDEGYRFYCQDMDLCLRAGRLGWKVEVLPDVVVLHHHGATISAAGGAAPPYHPELMWTDLVRFARKHGGDRFARRAAAALRAGARLRLFGRALATPLVTGARRDRWRSDSEAYRAGFEALRKT